MDINYKMLWVEDNDEWYRTLSRRATRFIKSKNLISNIDRVKSKEEFENQDFDLNNYEVLVIDLRLEKDNQGKETYGYEIIKKIRNSNYYNDILFYSSENEAKLLEIMKQHSLQGVFVSDRDHTKLMPKLQALIEKSIRRSENVINIRGIVMDITSEFDNYMVDIANMSYGLLDDSEKKQIKEYIENKLINNKKQSIKCFLNKYQSHIEWNISELLKERDFDSSCKARLSLKLFKILQRKYKDNCICNKLDNYMNKESENFSQSYNSNILEYRNKLAHMKINKDATGPVFIGNINGQDRICDESFCNEIRSNLISFNDFFNNVYTEIEKI